MLHSAINNLDILKNVLVKIEVELRQEKPDMGKIEAGIKLCLGETKRAKDMIELVSGLIQEGKYQF